MASFVTPPFLLTTPTIPLIYLEENNAPTMSPLPMAKYQTLLVPTKLLNTGICDYLGKPLTRTDDKSQDAQEVVEEYHELVLAGISP